METVAFILSILGTVCACLPSLLKGKNMTGILLCVFLANAFVGISYVITGAFNGAGSCFLGAVQTVINYFFDRKNKKLPTWLIVIYALSFAIVNLLVFDSILDIIALLATLAFVMSIAQNSGPKFRIWALLNASLWATYDVCSLSFGPLVTHGIQTLTAISGIVIHDFRKGKKEAGADENIG